MEASTIMFLVWISERADVEPESEKRDSSDPTIGAAAWGVSATAGVGADGTAAGALGAALFTLDIGSTGGKKNDSGLPTVFRAVLI